MGQCVPTITYISVWTYVRWLSGALGFIGTAAGHKVHTYVHIIYMYIHVGAFTPQCIYIDSPTHPSLCLYSLVERYFRVHGYRMFADRVVLSGSYKCSLIERCSRVHRGRVGPQSTYISVCIYIYLHVGAFTPQYIYIDRPTRPILFPCSLMERCSRVHGWHMFANRVVL